MNLKTQIVTLPNNFKIALIQNKNINSVSMQLRGLTGSIYESNDQIGASHILEHLLIQDKNKIVDCGAQINASTNREYVYYLVKVLKDDISIAIDYLSQIFNKPVLTEKSLRITKSLIEHEIHRFIENPEKYMVRLGYAQLFPNQRLASFNTGNIEQIQNLNTNKILEFYDKNYTASNFSLAVCGNFEESKIINLIENAFKNVKSGAKNKKVNITKSDKFELYAENRIDIKQAHLKISSYGFSQNQPESLSSIYLAQILGGKYFSHLAYELRTQRGFSYKVFSDSYIGYNYGLFGTYISCDENYINEVFYIYKNVCKKLCSSLNINLERVKKILQASIVFDFEKPSLLADYYSKSLLGDELITHNQYLKSMLEVSSETVVDTAAKVLSQQPKISVLCRSYNLEELKSLWFSVPH